MKLSEILTEAPIGLGTKMWTGVKQKAASAVPGMKNTAANLQGQQQYQQQVNAMYTQLNKYLGTMGKNLKTATAGDIKLYFKNQGLQAPEQLAQVNNNQPVDKNQIGEWLKTVGKTQAASSGQQPQQQPQQQKVLPTRRRAAQATTQQGGGKASNVEQRLSNLEQIIKQKFGGQ